MENANNVANQTPSAQPTEPQQQTSSFGWMGNWTKKKLEQAKIAQSSINSLLSLPGQQYKKLNKENAELRRRVNELSILLNENVHLSGPTTCGQVLALKGGELGPSGFSIGVEFDSKLLEIRWLRRHKSDESWNAIQSVSGGFYQTNVDDIDCDIAAEIKFTTLFQRLIGEDNVSSPTKLTASNSVGSLSSLASASSQEVCSVMTVALEKTILPNPTVEDRVKTFVEQTTPVVFENLTNIHDPLQQIELTIHDQVMDMKVVSKDTVVTSPLSKLRVCAIANSNRGLRLSMNGTAFELSGLNAEERDTIVRTIRSKRSEPVPGLSDLTEHNQRERGLSVGSVSSSSTALTSPELYVWRDCIYPQVWEGLEYAKTPQEQRRDKTVLFNSVTSLLYPSSPATSSLSSSPEPEEVSFKLYELAGFGREYSVEVDMADTEGLGITLSLHHLVRQPQQRVWPKAGASCVCISEFCPIVLDGEECKGQLEKCSLIRPGDALVAINDEPIEESEIQHRRDLLAYKPCTLGRVSKLVNRFRYGSEDSPEVANNPACKMKFTFAQSVTAASLINKAHNRSKQQVEELRSKLYEANERTNSTIVRFEQKLEKQSKRTRRLCEVVEEQRLVAEKALQEKEIVSDECRCLKDQVLLNEKLTDEQKEKIASLEALREEDEKKIKRLEASMEDLAKEGEAWVNTIGTKEDALRTLESDLQSSMIKNENLKELLDNATAEREQLRQKLVEKDSGKDALDQDITALKGQLEEANEEADRLTVRMRHEENEYENQIQRLEAEKSELRKTIDALTTDLSKVKEELSISQTHCNALKEANESTEVRANEAHRARQIAEAKLVTSVQKVMQLEAAATTTVTDGQEAPSLPDQKYAQKVTELEGANEVLRAQVRSFKARVQSLTVEASKVSQLDSIMHEKNDLLVKVQLEKAKRLEAEDELSAYKRALRGYAEQKQKAKREGVNVDHDQPSSTSKLFDHLYKRLLAED